MWKKYISVTSERSRVAISAILLAVLALSGTVYAQTVRAQDAATVFRSARDLITEGEWAKAQEKFKEYVSTYPHEKNLDAALYWLAYAQHKLERFDQVRATIERLLVKFPDSSWRDDARVLLVQAPGTYRSDQELISALSIAETVPLPPGEARIVYAPRSAQSLAVTSLSVMPGQNIGPAAIWRLEEELESTGADDPCEFKIVVLQTLFQTDLQRGIMAATDWLKPGSTQTVRCKSAALTLLSRNGGKAATPVILGVARSEPDVKLRARAISVLGATNDDSVIDSLREFALSSTDGAIVEAAVYALSRHNSERAIGVLGDIAISGKTMAQRTLAISSIAMRASEPAVDALFKIYEAEQDVEVRKAVIAGFANRKSERASNRLFEIARSGENVELRKTAITAISRRGDNKSIEFLLSLYDTEKNEELKDQIVNSLGSGGFHFSEGTFAMAPVAGASSSRLTDQRVVRKLIEIARNPQAPMARRKRAIGWLSRSKDPEVLKFLEELLK